VTPEEQEILDRYKRQRKYLKTYNRAKMRAWARLAKLYPEEFDKIFREERAFAQLEEEEGIG
jgi:hypothetical protein